MSCSEEAQLIADLAAAMDTTNSQWHRPHDKHNELHQRVQAYLSPSPGITDREVTLDFKPQGVRPFHYVGDDEGWAT